MTPPIHPSLCLRLFGAFELSRDGRPLPRLRSGASRRLLGLLALRHGSDVDRSWLAAALWPESTEEQARFNLRRNLTNLRNVLGSDRWRIESPAPRSLRLDLSGTFCDLREFDAALSRGTEADLRIAVELYRGLLLEDCAEGWIAREQEAREEACLGALVRLARAASERGDHADAARLLRRVVTADPLREGAQRQFMRTLAAAGDLAAVTEAYRRLCGLLQREVDGAPCGETTALYERLLREGGSAPRGRSPAPRGSLSPSARPSDTGAGPALPGFPAPADARARRPRAGRLPRPLTRLIGREWEAGEVAEHLCRARLVTLTGAGGVGKTRLAVQVASDLEDWFRDGSWFVDLAAVSDAAAIPGAIAAALDMRGGAGAPAIERLQDDLEDQALLLVLDNCEHLVDACRRVAQGLLQRCADLRILATSRQPLGVLGEVRWRVASLALPSAADSQASPEGLLRFSATQLFIERSREVRPDLDLTGASLAQVARICRILDGIPLAIEIAAAQVRSMTLDDLAARLTGAAGPGLALATEGACAAVPRHRTLRAALDWSFGLLAPEQRVLLRRLSIFAGGFSLDAAGAVGGDCGPCLEGLTALIDRSLVQLEEVGGRSRYRLLETVRQHAGEQLARSGERDETARRHREYYLRMALSVSKVRAKVVPARALEELAAELSNLQAALAWSLQRDPEGGLRLVLALNDLWVWRDHLAEGCEWIERLLRRSSDDATPLRARALFYRAAWTERQGITEPARACYQQALCAARRAGDGATAAQALHALGLLAFRRAAYDEAVSLLEESASLHTETGDLSDSIRTDALRGLSLYRLGQESAGLELMQANLKRSQEAGDWAGAVASLDLLGDLSLDRRDYDAARRFHGEKLAVARSAGSHEFATHALLDLARVERERGNVEGARSGYLEALEVAARYGSASLQTLCLNLLACFEFLGGDPRRASEHACRSLELSAAAREMDRVAGALRPLAGVLAAHGSGRNAARLLGAADWMQEACGALGSPLERAALAAAEGTAQRVLGDARFAAARSAGRALSLAQAVECAREAMGVEDKDAAVCLQYR